MYYANYTAEMLRAIKLDGVAFACANIYLCVRICVNVNILIYFLYNIIHCWSEDICVYATLSSFVSVSLYLYCISLVYYMCTRACLHSHVPVLYRSLGQSPRLLRLVAVG